MRRLTVLFIATVITSSSSVATAGASAIQDAVDAAPLPSLVITGPKGGADPPAEGPAGVHVSWSTGTGVVAGLTRSIDGGKPEQIGFYRPVATEVADGPPPAARQVFKLTQAGLTSKHLLTAVVQNGKVQITEVHRPVPPRDTPAWLDKLLQLAPLAILALFAVLTVLYLRSLRGIKEPADA